VLSWRKRTCVIASCQIVCWNILLKRVHSRGPDSRALTHVDGNEFAARHSFSFAMYATLCITRHTPPPGHRRCNNAAPLPHVFFAEDLKRITASHALSVL
jgi:hypothetical protein